MCLLMCCYAGPAEEGRKALAPPLDALPGPWFNWMGEMPYPAVQSMFDGLPSLPDRRGRPRVSKEESAWNCRDATWSMVIAGIDPNPEKAGPVTRWTKAYWEAVHPFDLGGAYPNFMMDDEGDARLKATYGDNYARLAAVKSKYDSAKVFQVNQNIMPAT